MVGKLFTSTNVLPSGKPWTLEASGQQPTSSDQVESVKQGDIHLSIESNTVTSVQRRKINAVQAWCRTHLPEVITSHHVWLLIHSLITIGLVVLYFTHLMKISGGTIAICELLFGVLVRNEIFISILHRLVALIPWCRYECNRMLHCIGGLHVSAACASFLWLLISLIFESHGLGARITGALLLGFILLISSTAIPVVRRRYHNTFEHVHRCAGWTSLLILIAHVIFLQLDQYASFHIKALINLPVFVLISILIIVFLPWLCIRKVPVKYAQPSKDLTMVTFDGALYPYGSTTRISLDGREWHAFAIALTNAHEAEHSILIGAVGDWTKALAESYRQQTVQDQIWIRRIKGLGFMYSIHAFRKVLIVCTGAGIAPALPYIKNPLPTTHTDLLWIAKQHEATYGEEVWRWIEKMHPHVTLHDTSKHGRPGVQLVEDEFWKRGSEAVFIVSNEKYTNEVVNGLWKKGIPCFGALFDS